MNCLSCHQPLPIAAHYCPGCGREVIAERNLEADDTSPIAAIGPTEQLRPILPPSCPKCQHDMVRGFIPEDSQAGRRLQIWVEGKPEHSSWTGQVLTQKRRQWYVRACRCSFCGYVESYARQEIEEPE